jgi:hypothetical protein
VAARLLTVCFGDRQPADVKAIADQDSAKFDAVIQSFMNVVPGA